MNRIIIAILLVVVVGTGCSAPAPTITPVAVPTSTPIPTSTSTPAPTSTLAPTSTSTPTPTSTSSSRIDSLVVPPHMQTPTPTPAYLTVATVGNEWDSLTSAQQEQYSQDIVGEVIRFQGRVLDVWEYRGGFNVFIRIQSNAAASLYGVSTEMALSLQTNQWVRGEGVIEGIDAPFADVANVEIQVTAIEALD